MDPGLQIWSAPDFFLNPAPGSCVQTTMENKTLILVTDESMGRKTTRRRRKFFFVYEHKDDPGKLFIRRANGIPMYIQNAGKLVHDLGGKEALLERCIEFDGSPEEFMSDIRNRSLLDWKAAKIRWLEFLKAIPEPTERQIDCIINGLNWLQKIESFKAKKTFKS